MRPNRAAEKVGGRGAGPKDRFWQEHVARQTAGGFSGASGNGLTEPSFYAWRRELTRRAATIRSAGRALSSRATSPSALSRGESAAAAKGRPAAAVNFARLDLPGEQPIEIVLGDVA